MKQDRMQIFEEISLFFHSYEQYKNKQILICHQLRRLVQVKNVVKFFWNEFEFEYLILVCIVLIHIWFTTDECFFTFHCTLHHCIDLQASTFHTSV